ncbi:MAG: tetratricopeptide repeat protein [Verrucomicrobiae bacterium]
MDKLAIKCGEYENSLPFPVGGSLTAGCRTGADIQLGDATDDGPLFVTLTNLGGGMIRVVDHEMGAVLVNSAPITEQVFGSPITLTLSDLGVDLQLAIDLPQEPSTGQSALPPIPDPASNHSSVSQQPATRKGIMVAGLILAVMGTLVFFYRPIFQALSSVQLSGTPSAASESTPVSAPVAVKAAANNVKVPTTNPAENLLAEGKKLEEGMQIAQAIEKYKGAADLGNAEAWNVLGILTMQGGDSKAPEAFGYFSKAADGGYPRGIYNLGLCYRDGVGTASDSSKALGLFQKASDLGIPEAMVALAAAYETGTGADADKAIQWYQKAAAAGNLDAMVALGKAYAEGNGVTRDEAKAATLFEQAAAKDRADAINNLGVLYAKGRGVSKDPTKAKTLYARAAELGNADAKDNLKTLEQERKSAPSTVESGATRADISPASQFEEKASTDRADKINRVNSGGSQSNDSDVAKLASTDSVAAPGNSSEQSNDSRILSYGKAVEKANAGDAYAQAVLSIYYGVGYKTQKNTEKSAALAMASAKQGHPLGIYRLGVMRQTGEGMQKSDEQGKKLKSQSIDGLNNMEGDPYALTALGVMLYRGEVVVENKSEAARVYRLAADQGYAPAQYSYAVCLDRGIGVPKDPDLARTYLDKAAAQFYPPALEGMPK